MVIYKDLVQKKTYKKKNTKYFSKLDLEKDKNICFNVFKSNSVQGYIWNNFHTNNT